MKISSHETRSRQFLEQLVGREHASRISRRNGPIDDTQVATFTWKHALRDLIQNCLPTDSKGKDFSITVDPRAGTAVLRDDGEGYSLYRQFTCSTGKLESETAAGFFGRGGTKEAPLTLALQDVVVCQRSRDWATVALATSYPEEGVKLLEFDHVTGLPSQKGTSVHLAGLTAEMIAYLQRPEENFLYFREKKGWKPTYTDTSGDSVVSFDKGEVFIRGIKVSDHPTALFGYNFQTIRAPLGRERDKFDTSEVSRRVGTIYATCTDQEIITSILRASKDPKYLSTEENFFWTEPQLEFYSLPHNPTDAVKKAWLDSFHALYGSEAILVDDSSRKNKARLTHVARAQGKTPVLVNETLARTLHKYGIAYDSDLTANYEDIMWTSGELENLPPGRLQQIDIPLHTKGERMRKDAVFHTVYAASAAQCIQDPTRTTYDISFVVYDSARRTHVVKREDLGKFLFENTPVNYGLKNPEDPTYIKDAKDLQNRLDALYRADTTKVMISAERIASWIQQVRVAIPRGTHKPLDLREIGDVYKEGEEIPYFVTPQEALAQLADFALTKEELIVIKANDWIAVPTKRETKIPGGQKVTRTVFDTWRGVPDDGQYVALTERASICQFLSLGETVLTVRARKPKVIDTITGMIPASERDRQDGCRRFYSGDTGTIGELYTIEDKMSGGKIFVDGFLVQDNSNTLFTYNVNSTELGIKPFHYVNDYPANQLVSNVILRTNNKTIIKKILEEAHAAGSRRRKEDEKLAFELTPDEKYYLNDARKKLWREAFTEVFGKEAVVATDSFVEQGNWLQYYCDADRSYRALAQRFGHNTIKLVSGIESTLIDAGVISDRTAFEQGVDYTFKTDLSGKTKSAYNLAVAATRKIQEHVNKDAERKHTYEVHFFTAATLTATEAVAKDLTYAKKLESVQGSEDITHHIYINVKEAEKIVDQKSAKQYVSELMRLALDEGTAREYAIGTITKDLEGAIKVVGGYKSAWDKLVGSFGGGRK